MHHEIEQLVSNDKDLLFDACELLKISDFSYDFVLTFIGQHDTHGAFLESIDHLNKSLISRLHALDIEIPYPTNTYVKRMG